MANPLKMLDLKPTGFQFIQEVAIEASPEKVWKSLANVNTWFQYEPDPANYHKHTLELVPGGKWTAAKPDGTASLHAVVTHIEPNKLLRLSGSMGLTHLPATNVMIFELQPQKDGKATLLRLGHRAFGFMDDDVQGRYTKGWGEFLPKLKALAEGR
jgi:uncharacterized protein YndB with AHSA1/START domain